RRDGKDQLDLAYVGGEANPATHRAEDRIASCQAQAGQPGRCVPRCERLENVRRAARANGTTMFFTSPENAHWNAEQQAIEFGAEGQLTEDGNLEIRRRDLR